MLLNFFRKRNVNSQKQNRNLGYAPLDPDAVNDSFRTELSGKRGIGKRRTAVSDKQHLVELCEEIIDASRELEETRAEYRNVTSYLKDVQKISDLSKEQKKPIVEAAKNIIALDTTRNEFLQSEKRLTDEQFAQMQEEENEIPGIVKRFKSNEAYLDAINKDMHYLEGEKMEWGILRQDCQNKQKLLRFFSIGLLGIFGIVVLALLLFQYYYAVDVQLYLIIAGFAATICGAYIILQYQECSREIKRCDVNKKQAVSLENRVKLKYVNIKNAVDYTCAKYHVTNSYELTYLYEQYQTTVKEQEKFRQTNDDLNYFLDRLVSLLQEYKLYDAHLWVHHVNALMDDEKLAAMKKDLMIRRQKLHDSITSNISTIEDLKMQITNGAKNLEVLSKEEREILRRIENINEI